MKKPHILIRASLLILAFAVHSFADNWIVRVNSASALNSLVQQYGATLQAKLHHDGAVYLIGLPSGPLGNMLASALKASPLVQSIEPDTALSLPEVASHGQDLTFPASTTTCASPYVPTGKLPPPSYYQDQPAVCLVGLRQLQNQNPALTGVGIRMALIDTWVDFTHPAFGGVIDLVNSRDFSNPNNPVLLTQETSPMVDQETSPMVDQETSPMVDGSGTIILNQETSPMVDQETSPMVDSKAPAYLGHGTGVAGIMHLTAPNASITALAAFSVMTGSGTLSSIVSAIYYAVDTAHVNVINMSFTVPGNSPNLKTLQDAIDYAIGKGVIVVASVPDSPGAKSYPAGYSGVTAVACTDNSDQVCSFSGHVGWASIYAPGYQVMSPYPGGKYALYTGTSFSAPWATGTGALIDAVSSTTSPKAVQDFQNGADRVQGVDRLNVGGAVTATNRN